MSIISKVLYRINIAGGIIVEGKFNKSTKNSKKINEQTLFRILKINEKSEFGKKFNFRSIKSVEQYKNQVPLGEYKDYESYILRMVNGEENVLTSDHIKYFGHTSGTTGKQKLIPATKRSRRICLKYMAILINKFSYNNFKEQWNYGKGLMIADIVTATYTKDKVPICSATSGGMKGIKNVIGYLYTSPIEVMKIKDKEEALYLHLLFALEEEKLLYIGGTFISSILDLFRVLEERYEELVQDIRNGSINKNLKIDDDIRKLLSRKISPNRERAIKLQSEFQKGFKGIARRVWKSLAYIATVTGGNFSIYNSSVNFYTDSIPIYSAAYGCTEAMIGINPYVDKIRYVIVPDTAYYEFIPVDFVGNKTFEISELELGKSYEVAVTNYAGLYRYKIGDVVRVVGFYNNSPEIEFLYRKNQILNMVAEKTNEDQLTTAVKNTIRILKLNLTDYTTAPDISVTPGRYIFYFEFWNDIPMSKIKTIEDILDNELRKSNLAYDRARSNRRLQSVKVEVLRANTFSKVKDFLFKKGVSKNQIKIPRVLIKNEEILSIISSNSLASKKYRNVI
ncbi:GH3 auxin-responsive promoter family protein [Clostridium hydrogenum]|uniref:GH3 auxin-responsive promoter family protein n=1 Tax=Clostridium hydrogenum TaxID=2855764 RepID=UPI001F3322CC|nr:GH3 auxin-responsive promoter family protein [Clostridium hydrogenum]